MLQAWDLWLQLHEALPKATLTTPHFPLNHLLQVNWLKKIYEVHRAASIYLMKIDKMLQLYFHFRSLFPLAHNFTLPWVEFFIPPFFDAATLETSNKTQSSHFQQMLQRNINCNS